MESSLNIIIIIIFVLGQLSRIQQIILVQSSLITSQLLLIPINNPKLRFMLPLTLLRVQLHLHLVLRRLPYLKIAKYAAAN